jgi:acyl transferase domain-containing protein/aryl carrier-like protein
VSDFIEHVLGELKSGKISRDVALDLLGRHAARANARPAPSTEPSPAGETLVFSEEWTREALDDGVTVPVRRIACVVDAGSRGALEAAFAAAAPQFDVAFVPLVATRGHFATALGNIPGQDGRIDALVYLPDRTQPATADAVEGILALLQGLHDARLACGRLLLCGVHDDALSRCHVESWIGIERTLRVLSPETPVAVLSTLTVERDDAALRAHVARVVDELCAASLRSASYVAQERQVLRLQRTDAAPGAPRLRNGGTYLITGGAGALGLAFARHLWRDYAANLILTGRGPLDSVRAGQIEQLLSDGAQVIYAAVDVADADAMQRCVNEARSRFGAVHGAIHAAGVEGLGMYFDNGIERVRQVLRPKVQGTQVLDDALRECPELDFLCCFSSNAAVLGDFGSIGYAVANRFQMAYAQAFGARSRRLLLSIGWPFWDGDGMGSGNDPERTRLYLKSSGQEALDQRRGVQLFDRLLQGEGGFRLVMCGDAQRLTASLGVADRALRETPRAAPAPVPASSPRRAAMHGLDLDQCIAADLTDQISTLLKLSREKILPRQNLTEYGFDSITLARWAKNIAQHYGIALTPAVFFSHPTLRQVVDYLMQQHEPHLRAFYREADANGGAAAADGEADEPEPAAPLRATDADESIAIVGMSGRFPQARSVEELWRILAEGRDVVTEIPLQRFDWRGYYDAPDGAPRMTSKWLGVMPGIDEFDPLFFEISPREAQTMDPRQRLLLQEAWSALEDAGYGELQSEREKIGLYVGVEQGEYQMLVGANGSMTGNHDAILASRLSYVLDLHGPAMAINTSCSSGLVAAHQACLALRANDCDAAVAAAVNLVLTPYPYLGMSHAGMLSDEGRCYAFDERANGMVPGEAVVALVLKRLSKARAAGDPIHAVIVASGINYDGKTNGITAPNGAAQAALIAETQARARIAAADIDYVVAHGTATRLGDPVEVAALDRAFGAQVGRPARCALTSTKSNLGHAFAASGLVSLVSLVLALRHETIPASLHCDRLSDYIDWSRSAFEVNRTNRPWPRQPQRRRLGAVSAFGMSGTNAHMIVRDDDAVAAPFTATAPAFLLVLSAATETALWQRVADVLTLLRATPDSEDRGRLAALSHTLLVHRRHLQYRCSVLADDRAQALALLESVQHDEPSPAVLRSKVPADFDERPALAQHARTLLGALPGQESDLAAYRETLAALADLYAQGYRLDGHLIYAGRTPQRLRLPAYPFARQRYWYDADDERREPAAVSDDTAVAGTSTVGVQLVTPRWDVVDATQLAPTPQQAFHPASDRALVVGGGTLARACVRAHYRQAVLVDIGGGDDIATMTARLAQAGSFDHVVWIAPQSPVDADAQLLDVQHEGVLHVFRLIKALLACGYGERELAWTVVTFQAVQAHKGAVVDPSHAGVHGLVGSMAKEMPRWSIRLVDLESDADWYVSRWPSVPADARARPWAYREGRWHRQQLLAVRANRSPVAVRRTGLVYVVVGGAGHVGTAWSEHVIREQQAQVVWLGRRPMDERIQANIDRLAAFGVAPEYIVADAADASSLDDAYRQIKHRHGRIDGVVLSLIHLDPRALADMDEAHFRAGLRAKVDASVRVVETFGAEPLQLVLFFSSVISFVRNPLQSAYAAGCAFADAFALALRQRWSAPDAPKVKIMNWGFWDRPENLELEGFAEMAQMGIGLITAQEAMRALDCLLDEPLDQLGIVKTTKPVLIEGMSPKSAVAIYAGRAAVPDMVQLEDRVRAAVAHYENAVGNGSAT